MTRRTPEELAHNYPFDPDKSPYSRFEEIIFPKVLIFGLIVLIIIIFAYFLIKYDFERAICYTSPLIGLFGVISIIIVKLMIRRREKKLGFE